MRNRQQLLGIAAIVVLGLLAADSLVFKPLQASWKSRTARIKSLRGSVDHGTRLLAGGKEDRADYEKLRTNSLSGELSVAQGQLLRAFDTWSQESGVSVSALRPQWKSGADDYALLECRADVSGSLANLTRFLYLVEKDKLAVKIDNVELSTRDTAAQQLNLGLQVSALQLNLKP